MTRLSFVIPAHNEERRIATCIRSIEKETAGHPETEIIVVDNASTDRTAEVVAQFEKVRLFKEPRKGVMYARHRGFEEANGELVAHIDADCELTPGWLEHALRDFERDPRLVCLSGPYIYHDVPAHVRITYDIFFRIAYAFSMFFNLLLGKGVMVMGGNYVVRKEAVKRAGGYDTSIAFYGDDTDVSRRMAKVGRVSFRFSFPVRSSGRRIMQHGVLRTGLTYVINYFWMLFFNRPFHLSPSELTHR